MGKYSNYNEVRPRDLWPTVDPDAIGPLLPYIVDKTYAEPCAGNGALIDLISINATCIWASDVFPHEGFIEKTAEELTKGDIGGADLIITNPPFSWAMLKPILDHLPVLQLTWLLLPASYAHNVRMGPYMKQCRRMVSIGRLYWVLDEGVKPIKGKDDYAWFLFDADFDGETVFVGRQ